jgi:hypothetical protein
MGTTLTGTTPQDTYDSLIKVTDNGPLSGSLKKLTDGLGNDSALSLSTGAIQLTGTNSTAANNTTTGFSADLYAMAVRQRGASAGISGSNFTAQLISAIGAEGFEIYTPNAKELVLGTNALERMRITSTGNVGIGTTPSAWGSTFRALQIGAGTAVYNNDAANGSFFVSNSFYNGSNNIYKNDGTATAYGQISGKHSFFTAPSGTAGGTVAFVERVAITSDGLTFNGDTAAANALDDYEEGTWTMGVSFGGASVGVTYTNNTGRYTKIGRQVTVNGLMGLSSKGTSTGDATITGLPFTIPFSNESYSTASLRVANITFANVIQAYGGINTTTIPLEEITEAGSTSGLTNADFSDSASLMVSLTYFV